MFRLVIAVIIVGTVISITVAIARVAVAPSTSPWKWTGSANFMTLADAIDRDDLEVVTKYLQKYPWMLHGALPDVEGQPLIAASSGSVKVARYLLLRGANVNARETQVGAGDAPSHYTPLHYASNAHHLEMVELLLANGADVLQKTRQGKTAIELAEQAKQSDIVDVLRRVASARP